MFQIRTQISLGPSSGHRKKLKYVLFPFPLFTGFLFHDGKSPNLFFYFLVFPPSIVWLVTLPASWIFLVLHRRATFPLGIRTKTSGLGTVSARPLPASPRPPRLPRSCCPAAGQPRAPGPARRLSAILHFQEKTLEFLHKHGIGRGGGDFNFHFKTRKDGERKQSRLVYFRGEQ